MSAPTGIGWTTIPRQNAPQDEQRAEAFRLAMRATALVDSICNQPLRATLFTEELTGPSFWLTLDRQGLARFQAARWPILQISSVRVSPSRFVPANWRDLTSDQYFLETSGPAGGDGPAAIMLGPGLINWTFGGDGYRVEVNYISGYPHAGLTAAVAAGVLTLPVDDCTGWAGVHGTIFDGAQQEDVIVTAVSAASGPGNLTLQAALSFAHSAQIIVSSMPQTIEDAAIKLVTANVLGRGWVAGVTAQRAGSSAPAMSATQGAKALTDDAKAMLRSFTRVL